VIRENTNVNYAVEEELKLLIDKDIDGKNTSA